MLDDYHPLITPGYLSKNKLRNESLDPESGLPVVECGNREVFQIHLKKLNWFLVLNFHRLEIFYITN